MNLKFYICFALFLILVTGFTCAQTPERVYKLENGTELTRAQVDSLSELYQGKLKFTYIKDNEKLVTLISLPENGPATTTQNEETQKKKVTTFGSTSTAQPEIIYLDTLENEISKEDFIALIKELKTGTHYKQEKRDGEKVLVMRPSTNKIAAEDISKIDSKKEEIRNWEGKKFPFETMTGLNGTTFNPSDFQGNIVVLNYWYVGCVPCVREMPELNKLVSEYSSREDILFIAPSLSDSAKIQSMLARRAFDYILIPDAGNHNKSMGIIAYPTNMIVDRTGKVQFVSIGYEKDTVEKMKTELNNLLN